MIEVNHYQVAGHFTLFKLIYYQKTFLYAYTIRNPYRITDNLE